MISMHLWRHGGPLAGDFILHPSRHLGPGWGCTLFPHGIDVSQLSARAHLFASRYLIVKLGLSAEAAARADRLYWAIALLPPPRLERFRRHVGTVLAAQEVRQIIGHDAADAYRQALGEELYWFVMQRAPLLSRSSDARQPCPVPEAIMDAVCTAGGQALRRMVESLSTELWRRLQLKLPYPPQADAPPAGRDAPSVEGLRRLALRILRETETTWIQHFMMNSEAASPEMAS